MIVTIKDGREAVYQGDIDRYLQLEDYAPATKVSFANSRSVNTLDVLISDDGTAPIPNQLLAGDYEGIIKIYIGTDSFTMWEGSFRILHRQLPADYVLEPTKVKTWSEILAEMEAVEQRVIEKGKEIEQIASSKGEKGDKGDKGDKGEKGDTGEAGYTPQRGTDYWTDTDKAEIVSSVLSQIENFSTEVF